MQLAVAGFFGSRRLGGIGPGKTGLSRSQDNTRNRLYSWLGLVLMSAEGKQQRGRLAGSAAAREGRAERG